MPPPRYRFAEFTLSPARRSLRRSGREVPLIPRYLDLLLLLVEKRAVALHRQEIFDRVWADVVVSDGALSQAVRTLRRTLGEAGERPFVRTVSRHGYQFVCPVVEEADQEETSGALASPVEPVPGHREGDAFAAAMARLVDPAQDEEARREAAEELHALDTAAALRRLDRKEGHARAWAHLRDSRWDVAGAGQVPLLAPPAGPAAWSALAGLRLRRAARLAASRWAAACAGGAAAGAIAGLLGGSAMAALGGSAALSLLGALALVGALVAGAGAAGVGCGLAAAEALVRSRRTVALASLGAAGGALVGAVAQRVVASFLEALFGLVGLALGGGLEGLVLGASAGLGFGLTTRNVSGGLAAPRGRARARTVAATALACALAAAAVSRAGGRLGAASLDAIVGRFPATRVEISRLGLPLREHGLGPRTRTVAGLRRGADVRGRPRLRPHPSSPLPLGRLSGLRPDPLCASGLQSPLHHQFDRERFVTLVITSARVRRRGPELALLVAFVASRIVARWGFGLSFNTAPLTYWQVLDLPLLRGDLLRSLFYLHSQPPLFNLALGIVLKAVPEALAPRVFEAAFLAFGYLGIVGMYALLVELGAPRRAAVAAALVQTLSTTWLVYESWLFYSLPTAVLVTWAAVWLARAARGRAGAAVAFAAAVAALSWIRATYQPGWAVAALGILLFAVRHAAPTVRKGAWGASVAALTLVLAIPAKNELVVGSFTSSTWLGMSLARMTTDRLDEGTRESWIAAGELSPVARVRPFSPLSSYPAELREPPPGTPPHPALVATTTSDGSPNFNHAAYVGIGRAYERGALVVLRQRPAVYLDRVRRALVTWLRPPTDYILVVTLREPLREWDRLHSQLILWSSQERRRAGPTLVLLPAVVLFLAALLWRAPAERRSLALLVSFPVLTIAWNFVVGSLVEVEENNRFRVEVEGLVVVLGSWGLIEVARLARGALRVLAPGRS